MFYDLWDAFVRSSLFDKSLTVAIIIVCTVSNYIALSLKNLKASLALIGIVQVLIICFLLSFGSINLIFYALFYLAFPFLISVLLSFLFSKSETVKDELDGIYTITYEVFDLAKRKKKKLMVFLLRGVATFGAAGSGKTVSHFLPLLNHCVKNDFSGIWYDYKDGEMADYIYYFNKNSKVPYFTFYPSRPNLSCQINIIDPSYLKIVEDIRSRYQVLMDNLSFNTSSKMAGTSFFSRASISALTAVTIRMKNHYPDYCTLPYVSSIFLTRDYDDIVDFINRDPIARVQGSTYLGSEGGKDQLAAVTGTLNDMLTQFMTPELAFLLNGNDLDLYLNDPDYPKQLICINSPKYPLYSSIIGTIIHAATLEMSQRGSHHSIIALDEAATFKLPNFDRLISTLRSYGVAFVMGIQDKVQTVKIYDLDTMKAILANISTKFFGKANDPDTSEWYMRFFPKIEKEQKSYSKDDSLFKDGGTRVNTSTADKSKYKSHEFIQLQKGEFIASNEDGTDLKAKFGVISHDKVEHRQYVREMTNSDYEEYFLNILKESEKLI